MADYQRLITTEDIQRRYNLQNLESERKIIHTLNNNLTKTFGIIKNYIACTTSLESKEQYFYNGTPTLDNYPASEWDDLDDHLNTLYYDREEGKVYIFKYNSDDDYYYWEESTDSSLLTAMSVANSQSDVSEDGLRRVFYEQPTVPYNVGDIWINGSKIYRCLRNETEDSEFYFDDWIDYLEYTDDVATNNALRILGEFKETVETEYATKVLLETTAQSITAEVSRVQTLAEGKSATYTEQPTPPYYRGDTYIKQVTDSETGITMNLIYVCQYSRETGTYHDEDFAIQPGYATLAQIKVTNDAITSTVAKVDGQDSKIASIEQTTEEINQKIQNIANITVTETSENGIMSMTGVNESEPIEITIIPRVDDISYLYPHGTIFPSDTLFSNVRTLEFHNTFDDTYYYLDLPGDLLYYNSEVYDEFQLHYGDGTQADPPYFQIIKRVGIDNNGDKYALQNEEVIPYTYEHVELTDGDYTITLLGYSRAYMKITLMASNLYTTQFATKVELNSAITQTSEQINLEVSKKVGKTEVISSINQTAEQIKIQASKIDIQGTITAINNDNTTTIDGNKITTGSLDASKITAGTITVDKIQARTITAEKIAVGTLTANEIKDSTIVNSKIANGTIEGSKIKSATISNSNIVDGTITGTKIAGGTITGAKIASSTITGGNIANATISGANIQSGTITNANIAGGTITNANIANGAITGAKIAGSTITGSNIVDATITNAKLSNISADKITAGTLSADRVRGGTLSGLSININSYFSVNSSGGAQMSTSGGGFLSTRVTVHPYVSALNVAHGSGGIRFVTGNSQSSSGSNVASVYMDNSVLYLRGNNGVNVGGVKFYDNYMHAGNIAVGGNYVNADSGNLNLNTQSGKKIYANGAQIGNVSDRRVKTNIKLLTKNDLNDIIKEIEELPTYFYDYKKDYGEKNNIGIMVQDIEEKKLINKYLHTYEYKGVKGYNHEDLSQLNFIVIKELINRINELEEKYGKTINN